MKGQIYKALSGFYYIQKGNETYQTRARGNFRKKGESPLVGDWVEFESTSEVDGMITKIYPRTSELKRPHVANVSQVIIVMSVKDPNFSPLLLDRFLVQAEALGMKTILYWSKIDLLTTEEREVIENYKGQYTALGYPVLFGEEGIVNPELFSYLKGELTVLMGQSGVGKSTLLNALHPEGKREIGEVSQALGRGRHTTRHTELWSIHDGWIVDTPGFSSLDLEVDATELAQCFIEYRKLAPQCKFRSCLHLKEPSCAVKEAISEGKLNQERYERYELLQTELANQRPQYQKKKKEGR